MRLAVAQIGQGVAAAQAGVDQQVVIRPANGGLDAAQHRGEEVAAQLGQQQADGVRPAHGQVARRLVGRVAQQLHGAAHALGHLGGDRRRVVDHAADGRDRHAGQPGDIGDGGAVVGLADRHRVYPENAFR